MSSSAKQTIQQLLSLADIKINGSRPFDIQVHDERLYRRIIKERDLGLGEAYMDGWWDAQKLDELIARALSVNIREQIKITPALVRAGFKQVVGNRQSLRRAKRNAEHHYNIGNDLYELMLDKNMIYSCAYWQDTDNLDQAQINKLDLICRKLQLKKGMSLLDIGCGWGGFAAYAAQHYGVTVTAITPAAEQIKLAKARTEGLPVTILQKDYREMSGSFDRIVSIGMLEHVGPSNFPTFFGKCHEMLKPHGLMLHHVIGGNSAGKHTNIWINKYIFPGGVIPGLTQISQSVEDQFIIEDVHNFGPYYDRTLMAWHHNFVKNYPKLKPYYDERFYRMWNFYLLICAGAFRARHLQLYQVVMRRVEPSPVYQGVR